MALASSGPNRYTHSVRSPRLEPGVRVPPRVSAPKGAEKVASAPEASKLEDGWGFDAPSSDLAEAPSAPAPGPGRLRPQDLVMQAASARSTPSPRRGRSKGGLRVQPASDPLLGSEPSSGSPRSHGGSFDELRQLEQAVRELEGRSATPRALTQLSKQLHAQFPDGLPLGSPLANQTFASGIEHLRLSAALTPTRIDRVVKSLEGFAARWKVPGAEAEIARARVAPDLDAAVELAQAVLDEARDFLLFDPELASQKLSMLRKARPEVLERLGGLEELEVQIEATRLNQLRFDGLAALEQLPKPPAEPHPDLRAALEGARNRIASAAELFIARGAPVSPGLRNTLAAWGVDVAAIQNAEPPSGALQLGLGAHLPPEVRRVAQWLAADLGKAARAGTPADAERLLGVQMKVEELVASTEFLERSPEQQIWWLNQMRPSDVPGTDRKLEAPLRSLKLPELVARMKEKWAESRLPAAVRVEGPADALFGAELLASGPAIRQLFEGTSTSRAALQLVDMLKCGLHRAFGDAALDELDLPSASRPALLEMATLREGLMKKGRADLVEVAERSEALLASPASPATVAPAVSPPRPGLDLETALATGRQILGPQLLQTLAEYRKAELSFHSQRKVVPASVKAPLVKALEGKKVDLISSSSLGVADAYLLASGSRLEGEATREFHAIREAQVELLRLTNGRGQSGVLDIASQPMIEESKRASYSYQNRRISLPQVAKSTLFHEQGHAIECDALDLQKLSKDWVLSNALMMEMVPLADLSVLHNLAGRMVMYQKPGTYPELVDAWVSRGMRPLDSHDALADALSSLGWRDAAAHAMKNVDLGALRRYKDSEKAYPMRDVRTPYAGKVYSQGFTEVISLGLEAMTDGHSMLGLASKAPEHLELILGVLAK